MHGINGYTTIAGQQQQHGQANVVAWAVRDLVDDSSLLKVVVLVVVMKRW